MPVEVIMPKVDMDMSHGTIVAWHVEEGAEITKSAPLFDIETDKATMEVESPASGTLRFISVDIGVQVPIGVPVAWIYGPGESLDPPPKAPTALSATQQAPSPEAESRPAEPQLETALVSQSDGVRATPRARKAAREFAIDLSGLSGTGPRGRIQFEDVRAAQTPIANAAGLSDTILSVLRSGANTGDPLVFLHGMCGDASTWARLETRFAADRPIIRIELPAHGQSPIAGVTGFPDIVASVRRAFDDLDLDRAHVVGHSLGGALALALTDTRPRAVASLTLLAPAGLGADINDGILAGICRATQVESLTPWLRRLVFDETLVTDNYARAVMATRRDPARRAAQQAMAAAIFPDGTQSFDLRAALERLRCETRIVWGRKDSVIPWKHALSAPGQISLNLFDRMGHVPQIEHPEAIGDLLARSIDRAGS